MSTMLSTQLLNRADRLAGNAIRNQPLSVLECRIFAQELLAFADIAEQMERSNVADIARQVAEMIDHAA
jgi:hypothetical protein